MNQINTFKEFNSGATDIAAELAQFTNDPLGFVLFSFPWGEPGTVLENEHGPNAWQTELLQAVGDGLPIDEAIQQATVSGNGVGKSAAVSWLILWATSTFEDTKGVVTANTETQLKTKTWAELGKWYHLFIGRELFVLTATALIARDPSHERTWRCDMVPWSERNVVAFQGLHNQGKRLFMIFDEASGIPDNIWEAADGCMTDKNTQRIWCVFGNPNSATGRFRETAPGGKFAHNWNKGKGARSVDSRTVPFTDKTLFDKWIRDYGEDSDFVRVRVRGVFPRTGSLQFIGSDLADEASKRDVSSFVHDPLIIGVDVARFGDDESVIFIRKGRDCRSFAPIRLRGQRGQVDTMTVAGRAAELFSQLHADAIFVDGTGVGGGVVDRLRQLQVPAWDIQFAGKSDSNMLEADGVRYANKRAEIWGAMREFLKVGAIEADKELISQITGPQYGYNVRNEIQLESKDDMKKRGLNSPDIADALALTFSYPVVPKSMSVDPDKPQVLKDYDPIETYEAA